MRLVRCEPQPARICDSIIEGQWVWEYGDEMFIYDELMQDHLYHNVYGNALDNADVGDNDEVEPILQDGVWFWKVTE